MKTKLPDLIIGDLRINPPIIQGGMGVRVSTAKLAAAVANEGALGVLASVGLGDEKESEKDYTASSEKALREQIRRARSLTKGYIGVNIMFVLTNYESLVKASSEESVDLIISGAGLPLRLPSYVGNSNVKLVPIVSSRRAAEIICETWLRKYKRLPDAIIVEGPLAGGHIGFKFSEIIPEITTSLEYLLKETLEVISKYRVNGKNIPLITAGGIFTGKDIARMLKLGASGVQIATRFVCTHECEVAQAYKDAYLKSTEEDIIVILSPVGLPGRVIKNSFVERIEGGEKIKFRCPYKCLKTCDPQTVNYCIADALVNASKGDLENGFAMCGAYAYRVKEIVSVKNLIEELENDAILEYYKK